VVWRVKGMEKENRRMEDEPGQLKFGKMDGCSTDTKLDMLSCSVEELKGSIEGLKSTVEIIKETYLFSSVL